MLKKIIMLHIFFRAHLVAISTLVSSGEFAAYLSIDGKSISVVNCSGETVFALVHC